MNNQCMSNFEIIKDSVTVPQAAEFYGIQSRNGMCKCPFHADNTPSMKLYQKNYHCFGCGAHGDVIGLTEELFGISQLEAAKRLNADFNLGLDMEKPLTKNQITMYQRKKQEEQEYSEWEKNAWRTLSDYYRLLCTWQEIYAPKSRDEAPDSRFIESLQNKEYLYYLCEEFRNGNKERKISMREAVSRFENRLSEIRREQITCVVGGKGKTERTAVL